MHCGVTAAAEEELRPALQGAELPESQIHFLIQLQSMPARGIQ